MKRWFLVLVALTVASQAIFNGGRILLSWRVLDFGGDAVTVGWFTAAFSLVPLLIAVPAGKLVDEDRAAVIMRVGLLTTVAATAFMALSGEFLLLLLGYVLLGLAHMTTMIAAQGMASKLRTGASGLDSLFAYLTLGISIGQLLGIVVAGWLANRGAGGGGAGAGSAGAGGAGAGGAGGAEVAGVGVDTTFALWVLCAASVVVLLVGWSNAGGFVSVRRALAGEGAGEGESQPSSAASSATKGMQANRTESSEPAEPIVHASVWSILSRRGMPVAMGMSISVIVAIDLITAYMPVLGHELGLTVGEVTAILAARSGAAVVSRALMPWVLRHSNRKWVMIGMAGAGTLPLLAMPFVESAAGLIALAGACGFAWGFVMPMTMTWVSELADDADRALALSVRLMGNRLAQVALPPVAGVVAAGLGTGSVYLGAGVIMAVAASATAKRLLKREEG